MATITIRPPWGRRFILRLTTNHPASSYGRPVAVSKQGEAFGPADLAGSVITRATPDSIEKFRQAGYEFPLDLQTPLIYAKTFKYEAETQAMWCAIRGPRETDTNCFKRLVSQAYTDKLLGKE